MAVMAPARVSVRNDQPGLIAVDVMPIEEAEHKLTREVHVRATFFLFPLTPRRTASLHFRMSR